MPDYRDFPKDRSDRKQMLEELRLREEAEQRELQELHDRVLGGKTPTGPSHGSACAVVMRPRRVGRGRRRGDSGAAGALVPA
jgi:hypothetical protein